MFCTVGPSTCILSTVSHKWLKLKNSRSICSIANFMMNILIYVYESCWTFCCGDICNSTSSLDLMHCASYHFHFKRCFPKTAQIRKFVLHLFCSGFYNEYFDLCVQKLLDRLLQRYLQKFSTNCDSRHFHLKLYFSRTL